MSFATTFQDHAQNHGPIYNLNFTSAQSSRDEKRNIDSFVRSGMKRGYFTPKSIEDILGAYLPSQVINEILTNLHRITSETHAEETLKSILHYVLSLNNARWKDMNRIMKRFKQSVAIATHSHNNRNRNQSPPQIGELDCDSDSEGVIEGDEVKPKLIRRTNVCKEHRHRKVAPANRSRDKYGFERGHNNHYMNHKRKQSEPRGPRPPLDQHRVHEHRHKHGSHDDKGLKREYKIRKSKKKPRTTCNSLPIPDFIEKKPRGRDRHREYRHDGDRDSQRRRDKERQRAHGRGKGRYSDYSHENKWLKRESDHETRRDRGRDRERYSRDSSKRESGKRRDKVVEKDHTKRRRNAVPSLT
eukprot:192501_1